MNKCCLGIVQFLGWFACLLTFYLKWEMGKGKGEIKNYNTAVYLNHRLVPIGFCKFAFQSHKCFNVLHYYLYYFYYAFKYSNINVLFSKGEKRWKNLYAFFN